ncbi:MAG: hypothetical protein BWY09_03201 [Candidatus Hydrogenedentes bacterium ADurb.Bin179]|nr:MAG: hypothetical protein BWY09_03201 [Candidatus Hydrogenedentes bacterium ADurb.Bin179]
MVTISDILRQAIRDSGLSVRRLSIHTGINRLCITRFLAGCQLTSDNLDALAHYFDLTLTPIPARTVTKRGKRKKD